MDKSETMTRYWANLSSEDRKARVERQRRSLERYYNNLDKGVQLERNDRRSSSVSQTLSGLTKEERGRRCRESFGSPEARRKANESVRQRYTLEHGRLSTEASDRMRSHVAGLTDDEKRLWVERSFHSKEAVRARAKGVRRYNSSLTEEEHLARARRSFLKPEVLARRSEIMKKYWDSLTGAERDDRIRSTAVGLHRRPTFPEFILGEFLEEVSPGEWKYNGDCSLGIVIGGKVPDFMNVNGKKEVIEVFGTYWHDVDEVEPLMEHYKKFGFRCLILWEYECFSKEDVRTSIDTLEVV